MFARFAREIAMESKKVAGNISSPSLAAVIARARAVNVPKENIDRAVAKGLSKEADTVESMYYELYGPAAVALVVFVLTDNRNRALQSIKTVLSKTPYTLGTPGCALWAFTRAPNGTLLPNAPLVAVSEEVETELQKLLEQFDDLEDVQTIYSNALGYESTSDHE